MLALSKTKIELHGCCTSSPALDGSTSLAFARPRGTFFLNTCRMLCPNNFAQSDSKDRAEKYQHFCRNLVWDHMPRRWTDTPSAGGVASREYEWPKALTKCPRILEPNWLRTLGWVSARWASTARVNNKVEQSNVMDVATLSQVHRQATFRDLALGTMVPFSF